MLRLLSWTLFALLLTFPSVADARRPWHPRRVTLADVSVVDAMGSPLRTFQHHGQTFVLGRQGERYAVVVRNRTAQRLEVVLSVDGRDAVHGRQSNLALDRGYVLPPHGMARIEGFRTSMDTVAAFRFTDRQHSFAGRMGGMSAVGSLRVAVFRERVEPVMMRRPMRKAPSAARSRDHLGTEFGESRASQVVGVRFERDGRGIAQLVTLRYDDEAGLEARGIMVRSRRKLPRFTQPPS